MSGGPFEVLLLEVLHLLHRPPRMMQQTIAVAVVVGLGGKEGTYHHSSALLIARDAFGVGLVVEAAKVWCIKVSIFSETISKCLSLT